MQRSSYDVDPPPSQTRRHRKGCWADCRPRRQLTADVRVSYRIYQWANRVDVSPFCQLNDSIAPSDWEPPNASGRQWRSSAVRWRCRHYLVVQATTKRRIQVPVYGSGTGCQIERFQVFECSEHDRVDVTGDNAPRRLRPGSKVFRRGISRKVASKKYIYLVQHRIVKV